MHPRARVREGFEVRKMAKRAKVEKIDGFGAAEKKSVRDAVRLVWQRSKARQTVKKRCIGKDGFEYCEKCKKRVPKVNIDHKKPAGEIDEPGFLNRLFCPSSELQGLCKECHKPKTARENKKRRLKKKQEKEKLESVGDFF